MNRNNTITIIITATTTNNYNNINNNNMFSFILFDNADFTEAERNELKSHKLDVAGSTAIGDKSRNFQIPTRLL